MLYQFSWRCAKPAARLVVEIEAVSDRHAGQLAAALLHDFVKGHRRELVWIPETPTVVAGS